MRRRRNWIGTIMLGLVCLALISPVALRFIASPSQSAAIQPEAGPSPTAVPLLAQSAQVVEATATPTATRVPPTATQTSTPTVTPTATPSGPLHSGSEPVPELGSQSVVLMDGDSSAVLYQKDAHVRRGPASVTKMMTAILAIERGKLDDWVTADFDPAALEGGSMMWVEPGEHLRLEDLLYGLMLPSGNDAAVIIAKHIAGSEEAFVKLMNDKAQELGMRDTHFVNPHGRCAEGHYTTAYDLAVLARYSMRNPTFEKLTSTRLWTVHARERSWEVFNLNKLLDFYPDADGIKIGFDDCAGATIAASVNHQGHRVYAVLLNSVDLWTDTPALYDWAFRNYTWTVPDAYLTPVLITGTPTE